MIIKARDKEFELGKRTLIMGILNITPDSFSDGGDHNNLEGALKKAKQMVEDGADIIDIGGQSTRPGHTEIPLEEEIARVIPVVKMLRKEMPDAILSVDTYQYEVAKLALEAGAHIINDVWGLQKDERMAGVIAKHGAAVVVMHNKVEWKYDGDVIEEIREFLKKSIEIATRNGISKDQIMIDPGIGFGKYGEHNIVALDRMNELKDLGPILLGTSRKYVVGNGVLDLPPKDRLEITITTNVLGIDRGAEIIRVHDIVSLKRAAIIADKIVRKK